MGIYRGEYLPGHPNFPSKSGGFCKEDQEAPVPLDAPKIEYSKEDEKLLEEFNRRFGALFNIYWVRS
jgi:alcohol oxidase